MRLVDLNPRWGDRDPRTDSRPVGVWFDCPGACCAALSSPPPERLGGFGEMRERIWVPFTNPIGGVPPVTSYTWERTGETFETLTLTPSVDFKHGPNGSQGWHGFITKGEVITC